MTENKAATTNIASLGLSHAISQINPASLGISSVLTASSPIFGFGESIRQFKETIDNLLTPQRMMREVLEPLAKQQREMFEGLAAISTRVFPQFPATTLPTAAVKEATEVLEGEIVKPRVIQATHEPEILVSVAGIALTANGRFYDQTRSLYLDPLNIGSTAGKYLMLLMTEDYYYLRDERLYQEIPTVKYPGGKEQLRQDLRKILLKYSLDIDTRRITKQGTTLVGIKRL